MGKRYRLFAGTAFPLLSLSLIFGPAAAADMRGRTDAGLPLAGSTVGYEVAQAQAPDGQAPEDQLKRKKPDGQRQGDGQEEQQKQPQAEGRSRHASEGQEGGGAEQQPGGQQQGEEHQHKHNNASSQQPESENPQPKAATGEPEGQSGGRHRQPENGEPEAQPQMKAQPQGQPAASDAQPQGEQQAEPRQKPHRKPEAQPTEQEQQPAASQAQPQAEPEQKPRQKPQKQPAEQEQQPAASQEQPQGEPQQKAHQKAQGQPADKSQPPASDGQQGELKVKPQQKPQGQPAEQGKQPAQQEPATKPSRNSEAQPGDQAAPATGQSQQEQPSGGKTQTEQQGQQAEPQTGAQPETGKGRQHGKHQQGGQTAPAEQAAPGQQTSPAGQNGHATTAAPQNGAAPQQDDGTAAQQRPATGGEQVSPQELERRKKIAQNPASSNETVVLPVQNGAAVLDSDKDAARRGRGQFRRDRTGQGQAAPGQEGQGKDGQGQFGQGQAGQGQMGQRQGRDGQRRETPQAYTRAPTSDAEAQHVLGGAQQRPPVQIEAVTRERGQRLDRRPDFMRPDGAQVQMRDQQDNRVILNIDNNYVVRHDDTERFIRQGERPTYEQLPRDRYRETIEQPDGDRVVTVRNRYGDIVQRSRIDARGHEYVLFYSPELEDRPDNDDYFRDPGDDLPPMRLRIPLNQYIIDTGTNEDADYYDFLREPPVEPVERVYSINEVRYSARIRDKVRRIDLDTITFATGSADIPMSQASTLRQAADAINRIVKQNPSETFLIEGHTDAVGSPDSNLILSDRRAESVANVLSDVYGIPAENLVTQGYGEQYLKVNTQGPEQENRRVTVRRITALVRPVASKQ
jgi:outer membrane protein OmpA-like peptidoglycan-associated protein